MAAGLRGGRARNGEEHRRDQREGEPSPHGGIQPFP
jgi:hypothetical protein